MNILESIIASKKEEVQLLKANDIAILEQSQFFNKETISLKKIIKEKVQPHIIAEFKRKSPSKGIINVTSNVQDVVKGYATIGASTVSILTDTKYFGGSNNDIINVATTIQIPILRKEFIIDSIQIVEAKSIGADIVLLIAACLTPQDVLDLAKFAKKLNLEVLLEIHCEQELQHINQYVDFVGVNNRNLKDFAVNLEHSISLCKKIPSQFIKVAESGIQSANDILLLQNEGFDAFLIGEVLMKNEDPANALHQLVFNYNQLKNGQ